MDKSLIPRFLLTMMAVAMTASAGMYLVQSNLVLTLFSIFGGAFCMTAAITITGDKE
jgi:hypothetical protein